MVVRDNSEKMNDSDKTDDIQEGYVVYSGLCSKPNSSESRVRLAY